MIVWCVMPFSCYMYFSYSGTPVKQTLMLTPLKRGGCPMAPKIWGWLTISRPIMIGNTALYPSLRIYGGSDPLTPRTAL